MSELRNLPNPQKYILSLQQLLNQCNAPTLLMVHSLNRYRNKCTEPMGIRVLIGLCAVRTAPHNPTPAIFYLSRYPAM